MTPPVIAFSSDFGLGDPYVAEVKAAILRTWAAYPDPGPPPAIIDVTHGVPREDVVAANWVATRTATRFPPGTIHLSVIDPGVGTPRPALAVHAYGCSFVGPGNGLFAHLAEAGDLAVVRLDRLLYTLDGLAPSRTFHGRDIFAPAAAHLAWGVPLAQLGSPGGIEDLGVLPPCSLDGGGLGRVVWIDRFGNAITDLERDTSAGRRLSRGARVSIGDANADGPVATYGDAEPGELFWYWGSGGTLEVALRDRSAASVRNLCVGMALNEVMP